MTSRLQRLCENWLSRRLSWKINIASTGSGLGPHMYGELFKQMAGVDMIQVPYRTEWSGEFKQMEAAEARLARMFGIAMVLIGLLLFLAFRSLLDAGVDRERVGIRPTY